MNHPISTSYLLGAFALSAAFYSLWPYLLDSPPSVFAKALPMVCLIGIAWLERQSTNKPIALLIALMFSLGGDILLNLSFANSFVYGLGSFLIAQLIYVYVFAPWHSKRWPLALLLLVMLESETIWLITKIDDLLVTPVTAYMLAISAMLMSAVLSKSFHRMIVIGAILFVISDSFIAINKFITPLDHKHLLIMSTYYAAQALILFGLIFAQSTKSDSVKATV